MMLYTTYTVRFLYKTELPRNCASFNYTRSTTCGLHFPVSLPRPANYLFSKQACNDGARIFASFSSSTQTETVPTFVPAHARQVFHVNRVALLMPRFSAINYGEFLRKCEVYCFVTRCVWNPTAAPIHKRTWLRSLANTMWLVNYVTRGTFFQLIVLYSFRGAVLRFSSMFRRQARECFVDCSCTSSLSLHFSATTSWPFFAFSCKALREFRTNKKKRRQ